MLTLCYLCPPLAILLSGRPFLAVLSVFALNPLAVVTTILLLALGCPPAPAFILLALWGPYKARAKSIALQAVNNKYQDRRFDKLGRKVERGNRELPAKREKSEPVSDPHVGMGGTRFRRRA